MKIFFFIFSMVKKNNLLLRILNIPKIIHKQKWKIPIVCDIHSI